MNTERVAQRPTITILFSYLFLIIIVVLLGSLYWRPFQEMIKVWLLPDSYYTHGFLVPLISVFFVWRNRHAFLAQPLSSSKKGWILVLIACIFLLLGDFLGLRVIAQLSFLPMLWGILLVGYGYGRTSVLWFPVVYLIFMIPIPPSLTQSIALQLKLTATEMAIFLANLLSIPLVRDGSMVYWTTSQGMDQILIGEICGGLRSLIALLAFGAIMAYVSKTRPMGKWIIIGISPFIAIIANVVRIFLLCVVGYFQGSQVAAGIVHDISGYLIFLVAFLLFIFVETLLRKYLPNQTQLSSVAATRRTIKIYDVLPVIPKTLWGIPGILGITAIIHFTILINQARGGLETDAISIQSIPSQIAEYTQTGHDESLDPHTAAILETNTVLIRTYLSPSDWPIQLIIVYAGSTRRSIHFPEVCLMGSGWEVIEQTTTQVGILFSAKKLVLMSGNKSQAVLYWFKTGDQMTGNYFLNTLHWAKNQMTFGSPTSAMIQIATPIGSEGKDAAFMLLEDFASKLYPLLLRYVP